MDNLTNTTFQAETVFVSTDGQLSVILPDKDEEEGTFVFFKIIGRDEDGFLLKSKAVLKCKKVNTEGDKP